MSLYVVFDTDQQNDSWQWHVGEKNPFTNTKEIMHIIEVQADGDELMHIYANTSNLLHSANRVVRWFGDDARFIVANCLK